VTIATDFLDEQADLYAFVEADDPSELVADEGAEYFTSAIRRTQARHLLAIGSGNSMLELGYALRFPELAFTLVEPSTLQHRNFRQVLARDHVDPARFEQIAQRFADYTPTRRFDLAWSVNAWYYVHSDEELRKVMGALRPGGEFLNVMWCEGSLVWKETTELGAAGRSRLGHLLSAEEYLGAAHRLGYDVEVTFHDKPRSARATHIARFLSDAFGIEGGDLGKLAETLERDRPAQERFWAHPFPRAMLGWLAYIVGTPREALSLDARMQWLRWRAENAATRERYAVMITTSEAARGRS
jgi:hypothetical protein